jgi:hypothetical protein
MSLFLKYRLAGILACALLALFQKPGLAATTPLDEAGFTKSLAKAFRKALPGGFHVKVKGPLDLEITTPDGTEHQATLQNVYSFCQRIPGRCEEAVETHVAQMSDTYASGIGKPEPARLRALLRPAAYADAVRKAFAGKEEPPIEPFLGDLWVICALDEPSTISTLAPGDLKKLGLSREEALALAKKNDAALLAPVEQVTHIAPDHHGGLVTSSPYEASRLLAPESWAKLAAANDGHLLVAAPGTDVVIYGDERQPDALQHMRDHVAIVASRASKPLSSTIFRWTPAGWVVVPISAP